STTVTVMSLLMTILSFFFLDSTSIAAYPFQRQWARSFGYWFPRAPVGCMRVAAKRAGEDPLPLQGTRRKSRRTAFCPCTATGGVTRTPGAAETTSLITLSTLFSTVKGLRRQDRDFFSALA